MKKILPIALLLFFISNNIFAQYQTVMYDYEKNYFNQGQPLPAEDYFLVNGQIPQSVDYVEVEIHKAGKVDKGKPLFVATWKRSYANTGQTFEVPVNHKLRGNSEYDVAINTYRKATQTEKDNLRQILNSSLDAYVDGVISIEKRRFSLDKPAGAMVEDLNDIVRNGTIFYTNKINFSFPGFSDIIKNKIKQIKDAKLRKGLFNFSKKAAESRRDARRMYGEKLLGELKTALHTELEQLINTEMVVLSDNKEIHEYPTSKVRNTLSVNAGYGGVYFNGGINDLSYDSAPYVGLSFPLGRAYRSRFLSNTSISFGAFLQNFEDEAGQEVTGPIFNRPYYVGLGYKVFQFIRLNAGATFLESTSNTQLLDLKNIKIKPFIGVSAEINLWMGLGNKGK